MLNATGHVPYLYLGGYYRSVTNLNVTIEWTGNELLQPSVGESSAVEPDYKLRWK